MFYSNPTGCTIFFFLEQFLAQHVSETDRATVTVSQHQYQPHGINTPKTINNLWLYTTVLLLTMDAVTSETCRAKNFSRKKNIVHPVGFE
jgi:hypothetical protein